jgi:NAD(P)H-dependent FMN reductase
MRLETIIASTRQNRKGKAVADWFVEKASDYQAFEVGVTDLAELNLPPFDEPGHPRLQNYIYEHTKNWSSVIEKADAICFVMPEYNSGFPATFKNAIDYLHKEWAYKPVGFISYGGVSGGLRAVHMAKSVLIQLRAFPVVEGVVVPFVDKMTNSDGEFIPNDVTNSAVKPMLDELYRVAKALEHLRTSA